MSVQAVTVRRGKRQDSDAERMLEETVYSHSRKSGENKRYKMRTLPRRKKKLLNIILTEAINTIKITNKQWRSERRKKQNFNI